MWLIPSLAPSVRPLAKARGSFAPVSIWGHRPTVGFASTYMRCVRLRRTALRATPRMHTSTQPPEGAGGSRSKAAGELTLGLLSGEEQRLYTDLMWERACSRRRFHCQPIPLLLPQLIVPTLPRGNAARDAPRSAFECLIDVPERRPFPRIFQVVRRKRAL